MTTVDTLVHPYQYKSGGVRFQPAQQFFYLSFLREGDGPPPLTSRPGRAPVGTPSR